MFSGPYVNNEGGDPFVSSLLYGGNTRGEGGDVVLSSPPLFIKYPPSNMTNNSTKHGNNNSNKNSRGHDHWKSVLDNILIEFLASLFIILSAVMYNGLREDGTMDACKELSFCLKNLPLRLVFDRVTNHSNCSHLCCDGLHEGWGLFLS